MSQFVVFHLLAWVLCWFLPGLCDGLVVARRVEKSRVGLGWTKSLGKRVTTRIRLSEGNVDSMLSFLLDEPNNSVNPATKWLVCGDGDLSFSATIAQDLADSGISMIATVLEDQETHHAVYKDSRDNFDKIAKWKDHQVLFGINATNLSLYFNRMSFDHIQFNFPHWRGKTNTRRNRELLEAFLKSASTVLSPHGQVHVALCQNQGGSTAMTKQEWRQSWTVAQYAAQQGLLLKKIVKPYKPRYTLSSHRGVDRPFHVGESPELYIFGFPNEDRSVEQEYQLCCRHELHIVLPLGQEQMVDGVFQEDVIHGDFISNFIKTVVPEGIRVEVPERQVLSSKQDDNSITVVYLIVYCGEQIPLTREAADGYRQDVEKKVSEIVALRPDRMGRLVSRPFPYPLLDTLIKYHYLM